MDKATQKIARRNRVTLVMLALVFLVPLAYAFWIYSGMEAPDHTKNHGDFVQPARKISQFNLIQTDGQLFGLSDLQGKWTLVYVGTGECDDRCAQALYKIRQSRMAQGEKVRRVQRLYIMFANHPEPSLQKVLADHKGMFVARPAEPSGDEIQKIFSLQDQTPVLQANRVYIVDPLGNLMMSYPRGFDARGLIKDLQHLLKASQIG